jgi:hypothetical protein
MLGAIVIGWLVVIQVGPAQEAPAPAQDKKPATAPTKGSDSSSARGGMGAMMSQMKGMMGGKMSEKPGGGMGMMGQMRGGMMGQPGKQGQAAEPTLEEMLNKALKDNPDIRVAEAKVREAEAELNRTRLQVTQKVLAFHHTRESQKAIVKVAEEDLQRIQKLEASKAVSQEEVKQAQQRLSAAKAKLAEVEGDMPYLLGQQHGTAVSSVTFSPDGKTVISGAADGTAKLWDAATGQQILEPFNVVTLPERHITIGKITYTAPEAGTIAEKVRKALDTQVRVDYRQKPVSEILDDLKKKAPGLSIHDLSDISNQVINLQIEGQVPLRTALELLEDTCSVLREQLGGVSAGRVSFVLRDYGLLFAPNSNLPPGAVHVNNLGTAVQVTKPKEKPAEKDEKKGEAEKKP